MNMSRDPKLTAAHLTRTVLDQALFINELLNDSLSSFEYNDRRFITQLVYGTVRNMGHIDFWITKVFKKPLKRIDPEVLGIIRISVYQMIFMTNREARSVVNEAVELTKKCGKEKAAGFVNYILREISRTDITKESMENYFKDDRNLFLQTYYSIPDWLFNRLKTFIKDELIEDYLSVINTPLGITLRIEGNESARNNLIEHLKKKGAEAMPSKDSKFGIYTSKAVNYDMIKEMESVFIQDESSQLTVSEMDIEKGDKIIDVCAAPGGKTLFASYLTGDDGSVVAVDVNRYRLKVLADTAIKYNKRNISIKLHDATIFNPEWEECFDKVLIDAPCSSLGTIRRHPEIKWLKNDSDPKRMASMTSKILESSCKYVKKGGVILFSVCTFTQEETTDQIQNFISSRSEDFTLEKSFYTVSSIYDNRDAFFICKIRRIK
jgi:16S rRNA (cytosine967-C5)-methyltransferase